MNRFFPLAVVAAFLGAPSSLQADPGALGHAGGIAIDETAAQVHLDQPAAATNLRAKGVVAPRLNSDAIAGDLLSEHHLREVEAISSDLLTEPTLHLDQPHEKRASIEKVAIEPPASKAGLMMAGTGWAFHIEKPIKPGLMPARTGWAFHTNKPTKAGLMTAGTGWAMSTKEPMKPGLLTAGAGWSLLTEKSAKQTPTLSVATNAPAYDNEHSLQLRAYHDNQGGFICIGEVKETSPLAVTILLASGSEKTVEFDSLSYADRAFLRARNDSHTADLAGEFANDHGYRLWRYDSRRSSLKAKVIAYDGRSVRLKGKTPDVTTLAVRDLDGEDQAHLQRLASVFRP